MSTSKTIRSGNQEVHPLQNGNILQIIFSFCSVNDLKNCRLVESMWLKESLKSWRKEAVLILKPEPEGMRDKDGVICLDKLRKIYEGEGNSYFRWRNYEAWTAMDEANRKPGIFLRDLQVMYADKEDALQLKTKPFKKLKLEGFCDTDPELSWTLETFSSHIGHLTLKNVTFSTVKSFLDTVLLKLPSLQELKLVNKVTFRSPLRRDSYAGAIPVYPDHPKLKCLVLEIEDERLSFSHSFPWKELLSKLVNLQDLRLIPSTSSYPERRIILNAIASIRRNNPSILQIRNLDILPAPLTENGFTELRINREADISMPLVRLSATVGDVIFLKPFSETLKFLSLRFSNMTKPEPSRDDPTKLCLPHIKEFHADGDPDVVMCNLNKVETPKLETLVVDDILGYPLGWNNGPFDFTVNNPSFGNVTRLELYNTNRKYIIDLDGFQRISKSMPNVLHAKMPLTKKAFTELCRMWPNIITLTISDSNGYTRQNRINDRAITGFWPNTEPPANADRLPNITNLTKLTHFEASSVLTDHSIKYGFLHLPRIHSLHVTLREVSNDAMSALVKKFL